MGVLQDFERRLEGAVEGFFARAFRSGVQPVELAKALQRHAADTTMVTEDGVVVPNAYRILLAAKDLERLEAYGDLLATELETVVTRTAGDRGWHLRGPVRVEVVTGDGIRAGRWEVRGRVEAGATPPAGHPVPTPPVAPAPPAPAPAAGTPATAGSPATLAVTLTAPDGTTWELTGPRVTVGRMPDCDVVLEDATVSREHAALVRRSDGWWVLDLGSTNGTRVDGVGAAEQRLRAGAEVRFGDAVLVFGEA